MSVSLEEGSSMTKIVGRLHGNYSILYMFVVETEQKFRSVFIACQRSRLLCVLIVDSNTGYIYRVPVPELDFAERIGSCQLLGREFASSELSIGTLHILSYLLIF